MYLNFLLNYDMTYKRITSDRNYFTTFLISALFFCRLLQLNARKLDLLVTSFRVTKKGAELTLTLSSQRYKTQQMASRELF